MAKRSKTMYVADKAFSNAALAADMLIEPIESYWAFTNKKDAKEGRIGDSKIRKVRVTVIVEDVK